jgi:hypothetical protein
MDVDDAGDGGIAMAEKERDFVDALAGEEGAGCDRVAERVHRGHGTGGYLALIMQRGESRLPVLVPCAQLCLAERATTFR